MDSAEQTFTVGVRFSKVGKIYHFDATALPDLRVGDSVVVETSRGWQLGEVAQVLIGKAAGEDGSLKAVDRRATPRDLLLRQSWMNKEQDVVQVCRGRSKELNLRGVKVIASEYSFDGSRLTIMFSSETEDKVDLKSLRQDMQKVYSPSQVELRQIGPRDVAKFLGGMGACGLETRCCSKFLTDFNSISIRMAKEQGISLTPTEITGMCGRLRCCLIYEYQTYCEYRQMLPKRNKRVITPDGEGKVVNLMPLQLSVMVDVVNVGYRQYSRDDIRLVEDGPAPAVERVPDEDVPSEPKTEVPPMPATPPLQQSPSQQPPQRRPDSQQRPSSGQAGQQQRPGEGGQHRPPQHGQKPAGDRSQRQRGSGGPRPDRPTENRGPRPSGKPEGGQGPQGSSGNQPPAQPGGSSRNRRRGRGGRGGQREE